MPTETPAAACTTLTPAGRSATPQYQPGDFSAVFRRRHQIRGAPAHHAGSATARRMGVRAAHDRTRRTARRPEKSPPRSSRRSRNRQNIPPPARSSNHRRGRRPRLSESSAARQGLLRFKISGASLRRTDEGGCPHVVRVPGKINVMPSKSAASVSARRKNLPPRSQAPAGRPRLGLPLRHRLRRRSCSGRGRRASPTSAENFWGRLSTAAPRRSPSA